MFHLVGIVGNNYSGSLNRALLQAMQRRYADQFTLTLLETKPLPLFSQDDETTPGQAVRAFRAAIATADGVIIATPEHNHSLPAVLKNALDWCSRIEHPLEDKRVMVVGASLGPMGTVRAQAHLRQILDSPGIGALTLPGNEFLMGLAGKQFDAQGNLTDPATRAFLDTCVANYLDFLRH
ncbi:NADPH-dependent FMN reductase [Lacticaseibacillus daqingensis]|uniref:NADPH-dependent FMN reductase n=1 Tax=Lacticaseibacillus daqingensis TaxID=2486014 RepID=UPI000F7A30DB|nr:NADPH-dependent FMN reductase [Lacticaseibacillus daqingensis]